MEKEIIDLIPSLKNRTKKSVRLLPQKGEEPGVNATKLGGLFLWSQDEPWLFCNVPEVALFGDYKWGNEPRELYPEIAYSYDNIWEVSHPKHNDAFVSVLQIRSEDIPLMRFPSGKNIFQLLWCPREHDLTNAPRTKVVWRNENSIEKQLEQIPKASFPEIELTPETSSVLLQEVTEYPSIWELSNEERNLLDSGQKDFYFKYLEPNAGIKVGGHPSWIQDPEIPVCECGNNMEHLLTIGSDIFEDYPNHKAPGLVIGDCGSIYIFICCNCSDLPIETVFQCS